MAKQSLALGLQTCLGQHRTLLEDYSDFRVVVEGVEFPCHRLILASCSTFFRLLLGTNMKERSENRAFLRNINKETFTVIVNTLYEGEDGLNRSNIVDVWYASHMLDISYLFQECEQFVQSVLDIENYIQFYHHAKILNSESVTSSIYTFILENFKHFLSTQAFIYMSFEEIHEMIADFNLNVSSEEVVIETVLDWIKGDGKCEILEETIHSSRQYSSTSVPIENNSEIDYSYTLQNLNNERSMNTLEITEQMKQARKAKLSILLSSARLCLVRADYLENLLFEPLIVSDPESVVLVKKALMYHWKPERSFNSLVRFRKCHEMMHVMVFVKDSKLSFYSLEDRNEVFTFQMHNQFTHISAFRDKLFLCYNETSVSPYYQYNQYNYYKFDHYILFDVVSKNRSFIAKIQENPGSFFMCNQSNIILFSSNESSEKLIQLQNSNKSHGVQLIRTENKTKFACIHRDHIFAFSDKNPNTEIHIYKIESKLLVGQKEISGSIDNMVSFQVDEKTYILQRNGDLWVIENVDVDGFDLKKLATLWNLQWCLRGAVCFSHELFLFGDNFKGVDNLKISQTSLAGVFDRIEVVIQSLTTQAVPMIVPRNIQQTST